MKRSTMLILCLVAMIAAPGAQTLPDLHSIPGIQPGSMLILLLRGDTSGQVYGSDIYTGHSSLAAAAVHAGILQAGSTGMVYVEVLPGLATYSGSNRNGVTSQNWGSYGLSFRFLQLAAQQPAGKPATPGVGTQEPGRIYAFKDESALSAITFVPGTSFYCRVTGSTSGRIWGTDIYTSDSSLNTAAVHAGIVKPGETAIVKVTMEGPRQSYQGSTRNGVTSASYGSFGASYTIAPAPGNAQVIEMIPAPGQGYQIPGATPGKSFVLWVLGQPSGSVWGTDIYTADSTIAAASVHAGLLRPGEAGPVLMQILPGQNSYTGSTRNGVTSASYGSYPLSYSLSPVR